MTSLGAKHERRDEDIRTDKVANLYWAMARGVSHRAYVTDAYTATSPLTIEHLSLELLCSCLVL